MNELNYASLEASKKLVDNGIVLSEVDFMWFEHEVGEWILMSSDSVSIKAFKDGHAYPAPCFTDVWRELPAGASVYKGTVVEVANTAACMVDRIKTPYIERTNPTDALINLLVWLKGAGK
jgi:hypothetical protein